MKIALISDIHGNHIALTAVLAQLDKMGITKIVCLGDIGGYYCQINECCEELQSRNILSLMGNHDWYLSTGENCPRSNSANICLEYQRTVISDSNRQWLTSLKPKAQIGALSVVHGGWVDLLDEYVVPTAEYFSRFEGNLFASGHTHVPCVWKHRDKAYCNPGSVGQPRDFDPKASFAVLTTNGFLLHRVEYDYRRLQEKMKTAGFSPYFYENLAKGARIGWKSE